MGIKFFSQHHLPVQTRDSLIDIHHFISTLFTLLLFIVYCFTLLLLLHYHYDIDENLDVLLYQVTR